MGPLKIGCIWFSGFGSVSRPAMPGDNGRAVIIPDSRKDESKEKFKIHQFNLVASEMMSLNRTLPDYRIAK